jgi:hypothetical protein
MDEAAPFRNATPKLNLGGRQLPIDPWGATLEVSALQAPEFSPRLTGG